MPNFKLVALSNPGLSAKRFLIRQKSLLTPKEGFFVIHYLATP
jgi:hypothetical protein